MMSTRSIAVKALKMCHHLQCYSSYRLLHLITVDLHIICDVSHFQLILGDKSHKGDAGAISYNIKIIIVYILPTVLLVPACFVVCLTYI